MSILKTAATSRAARLTAIGGIVAASLIGLSSSAEAATASLKLSSSTGSSSGGDILTITGKSFMDSAYTNQVLGWDFTSSACTTTATNANQGDGVLNVTSATSATLKTPTGTLTAGTWYLCFWDTATGTASIIGQAKFTTAAPPTVTSTNGITEATGTDVDASSLGGTVLTIVGTEFSRKAVVSVDGVAATKTTYVSSTKLTAVLAAHAAGTDYGIKVTTEYGSVTTTGVLIDYQGVLSVSPTVGKASTATAIKLTGQSFLTYNSTGFSENNTTASKYVIVFVPGGTTLAAGGSYGTAICTSILVESDTSLSCKTPATLSGAYSVQIVLSDDTTAANIETAGVMTVVARSATYTAANI